MDQEANLAKFYRQARRDFIAACQHAGAGAISRVHPARGPDGGALFCDSAAFGPRDADRALLLIGGADGALAALLDPGPVLPDGTRLVAVHALDPHAWVWGRPGTPADWPQKTLAAIAAEDLSRVQTLTVLDLQKIPLETALAAALPGTAITFRTATAPEAEKALAAAIAAL